MCPVKQFPSTGNPVNDRRAFINALLNGDITATRITNEYPIEYEEPEAIDYDMVAVNGVYISINETNPSITLGYGTWIRFANGRCLIGVDETDNPINAPNLEIGAKTSVSSGSINAQTFTGNSVGSNAVSAGTPAGTNSAPTFTGSALTGHSHGPGTIVPSAHAGSAVADHVSHTHTYTQVPNHVHVERVQGGTTASTTGTHIMTSSAAGGSLRSAATSTLDPTGASNPGITAGPGATMTHNVTQPSAHTN